MVRYTLPTTAFLLAAMIGQDLAQAQMFGERTLGRPLSIQEGAAEMESAGTLTGRERFLRENRPATAFVGPDIRELQRFIGALQAQVRGQVQPSTQGLGRRVDRSAEINQPLGPAPAGTPYNPELVVSYPAPTVSPPEFEERILNLLAESPRISESSRVAVLVEGQTAILRGEVPSERDRDLIPLVLAFEPGIWDIRNELEVNPRLKRAPDSLAVRRETSKKEPAWITLSHSGRVSERAPAETD